MTVNKMPPAELSKEQLKNMNQKELTAQVKSLSEQGYNLDYNKIKNIVKEMDDVDDAEDFLRKKIRHALREPPAETKKSKVKTESKKSATKSDAKVAPSGSSRHEELKKMNRRTKNNERDLMTIATELGIPKRTSMNKEELITAILDAEKRGVKPVAKKSSKKSEEEVEEEEKVVVKTSSKASPKSSSAKASKASPKSSSAKSSSAKASPVVDISEEEEEIIEQVQPAKASKASKSASAKASKASPKSSSAKASKASPSAKSCGKYSHEELLEKRLGELQKILADKGLKNTDNITSVEQASDLVCQMENNQGQTCDKNYSCGDDMVCDITTKPGICVDKGVASKAVGGDMAWLDYNGKHIIGSSEAIKALRKKLSLKKYKEPDQFSAEGFERKKLLTQATRISGKSAQDFRRMNNDQIRYFIEGYDIEENRTKGRLRASLPSSPDLTNLSVQELRERASLIKDQALEDIKTGQMNREEMIEILSSWLDRNPADFAEWSNTELNQRISALQGWERAPASRSRQDMQRYISDYTGRPVSFYEDWSLPDLRQRIEAIERLSFDMPKKELLRRVANLTGRPASFYKDWAYDDLVQRLQGLGESQAENSGAVQEEDSEAEEETKETSPASEESEAEQKTTVVKKSAKISKPVSESEEESDDEPNGKSSEEESEDEKEMRKKQEKIDIKDVEKVLSDVMAGKGKIDEFSQVQNSVLKCIGLIS